MNALFPLLFPPKCVLCRTFLENGDEAILCADCAAAVRAEYRVTERVSVPGTDGAASALQYKGLVRNAMHRFKFRSEKGNYRWFAAHTAGTLAEHIAEWKPDILTYVPLGFSRWRERGYNQSALVARLIAKQFHLPCKPLLRKHAFVRRQSKRQGKERFENVQAAFYVPSWVNLAGQRIVIIDDVLTTGATLSACAETLRAVGAERVFALSVTKTPHKGA